MIPLSQPGRLCVRNLTEGAGYTTMEYRRLVLECADDQTLILRLLKDFIQVKTEERLRCVLSACTKKCLT